MSFSKSIRKLNELNLNDLDFENLSSWPTAAKIIACILVFSLTLGLGYFLLLSDLSSNLNNVKKQELRLKKEFVSKSSKANSLEAYQAQLQEINENFSNLLKQLPTKTEVPELLEDITYLGLKSGLVFDSINVQEENIHDFYIELPIKIKSAGGYHEIAGFVSGVANLSRIVTLHDFTIRKVKNSNLLSF